MPEDKKQPKISIFLPIYNKEKYIKSSIKCLQSQTLKNIEIIAVNDFSNDKSLEILKDISDKDKRIKILNNKHNRGLLYSRTIGILNSNGEYLMNLDPDDNLADRNCLKILYNKAKKNNVDILSFGAFFKNLKKKIFKCSKFHTIIFQPQILNNAFDSHNYLNDFLLWNKLIRKELFIKVYKLFIVKIYRKYWNYHEDNIWSILTHKFANSMFCIRKIIYIYNNNQDSLMQKRYNRVEIINLLYRHQMYKRIFTNQLQKKYLNAEIMEIISIFQTKKNFLFLIKEKEIISKYKKIIVNFINNHNLSKSYKTQLYEFFQAA